MGKKKGNRKSESESGRQSQASTTEERPSHPPPASPQPPPIPEKPVEAAAPPAHSPAGEKKADAPAAATKPNVPEKKADDKHAHPIPSATPVDKHEIHVTKPDVKPSSPQPPTVKKVDSPPSPQPVVEEKKSAEKHTALQDKGEQAKDAHPAKKAHSPQHPKTEGKAEPKAIHPEKNLSPQPPKVAGKPEAAASHEKAAQPEKPHSPQHLKTDGKAEQKVAHPEKILSPLPPKVEVKPEAAASHEKAAQPEKPHSPHPPKTEGKVEQKSAHPEKILSPQPPKVEGKSEAAASHEKAARPEKPHSPQPPKTAEKLEAAASKQSAAHREKAVSPHPPMGERKPEAAAQHPVKVLSPQPPKVEGKHEVPVHNEPKAELPKIDLTLKSHLDVEAIKKAEKAYHEAKAKEAKVPQTATNGVTPSSPGDGIKEKGKAKEKEPKEPKQVKKPAGEKPTKSSLLADIEKIRSSIVEILEGDTASLENIPGAVEKLESLDKEVKQIREEVRKLQTGFTALFTKIDQLLGEGTAKSGGTVAVAAAQGSANKPAQNQPVASNKSTKDDDDIDLFGSDEEEDPEADKLRQERLASYEAKKSKKPALIAKSNVILDVKPWDDETDLKEMEQKVRSIHTDGLLWGVSKIMPIAYGINKLQISCVVEDDKVSVDWLEEQITNFEDYVQSVDIVAFNKI